MLFGAISFLLSSTTWSEFMIDPKLNELVDTTKPGFRRTSETGDLEDETPERTERPRRGLSVNDTIAGTANLSVGARGADTSGVRAGAAPELEPAM